MSVISITGAGGAIGQALVDYLLENTEYSLNLNYSTLDKIPEKVRLSQRCNPICGNIESKELIMQLLDGSDCLIHLAQQINPLKYSTNYINAYHWGVDSSLSLFEYLRTYHKDLHIIFPSSGGTVYSRLVSSNQTPFKETEQLIPSSPYGAAKIALENYLLFLLRENKNLTCNILRISNPYGLSIHANRKQGIIDVISRKLINEDEIQIWGGVDTIRDYIFASDLMAAFLKAIDYRNGMEIFNIGSGQGASISALFDIFKQCTGNSVKYTLIATSLEHYISKWNVLDISKANKILLWKPKIDLNEGVEHAYKKNSK